MKNASKEIMQRPFFAAILLFFKIPEWTIAQILAFFMFSNIVLALHYEKMQSNCRKCIKTVFGGGHFKIGDVVGIFSNGTTSQNVFKYVF